MAITEGKSNQSKTGREKPRKCNWSHFYSSNSNFGINLEQI
mgnify:CR=1 FL=1